MPKLFTFLAVLFLWMVAAQAAAPTFTSSVNYAYTDPVGMGMSDTLSGLDTVVVFTQMKIADGELILQVPALLGPSQDTAVVALHIYRYDKYNSLISEKVTDTLDIEGGFISVPCYGESYITGTIINRTGATTKVFLNVMARTWRSVVTLNKTVK
jgi:hypothetical protein